MFKALLDHIQLFSRFIQSLNEMILLTIKDKMFEALSAVF